MGVNKLNLTSAHFKLYYAACMSICLLACSKQEGDSNPYFVKTWTNDTLYKFTHRPIAYYDRVSECKKINVLAFQTPRAFSPYIHLSLPLSNIIKADSCERPTFFDEVEFTYFKGSFNQLFINSFHYYDKYKLCIVVEEFNIHYEKDTIASGVIKINNLLNYNRLPWQEVSFLCPIVN